MYAAASICSRLSSVVRLRPLGLLRNLTSSQFHSTPLHSNVIGSDYVVRCPFPDIQLPTEDIYGLISKDFPTYGSKVALVEGISGQEYSYNEVNESIINFSSGLHRLGFEKGNVLGIVAPNCPEYAVLYLGTLASGGVVSTCNPTFTANELAYQFKNSGTKYIATVPAILPTVKEAAQKANINKIIILGDSQSSADNSVISYHSLVSDSGSRFEHVRTDPDDVVVLPYSSGTTGLPKGVMLTNLSVGSNVLQMTHPEFFNYKEEPAELIGILPFFHIYGMVVVLLSSLQAGMKLVTLPKFEAESFLSTLQNYRTSIAHLVPPLVLFFAKHPIVDQYNLSSLNQIMTGAAPLSGDTSMTAKDRINCQVIRQGYGLSETSPVTHIMPRSLGMDAPSSIGHCIRSVETKIVDLESGENLPPNKEGELWIRGPNVMKGYLNNPQASRDCLTEDKWFKTGDIGECLNG